MKLDRLPKTTTKKTKRLGRGYGSGVGGHTTNRGQKGQKARNSIAAWFEGGQLPQIRRFPFIRGKSRFKSLKPSTVEINLDTLNRFKANQVITVKTLIEAGLVGEKEAVNKHIRVLGRGQLDKPLTVALKTSKSAKEKIEAAGGKVDSGQTS